MNGKRLAEDLRNAMIASIEDNGGTWEIRDDFVRITIQESSDPSKSRNGGDYSFYREFRLQCNNQVEARDTCSCDFWQPDDMIEVYPHQFSFRKDFLARLARKIASRLKNPVAA